MIFSNPIRFEDAIASNAMRALLPVSEETGSADLLRLRPEIRQAAVFSARTRHASHLARIQDLTGKLLGPPTDPRDRVSLIEARQALRESLREIGYTPEDVGAAPGSLRDLGSDRRLNLILEHNVRESRGRGHHVQTQTPAILRVWPAQELVRVHQRKTERGDWPQRFVRAGGRLLEGRMVALKNDPVWETLSRFGNPWPPFDFGSGMGLRDVDRREALRLGLIQPGELQSPDTRPASPLRQTLPATSGDLRDAITARLGRNAEFSSDGVLTLRRAVHPNVGKTGSAKEWNLPIAAPSPPPPELPASAVQRMVDRGYAVQDFLGEPVKIAERLNIHNASDPKKYQERLTFLGRSVATLREPDELWLQQRPGKSPVRIYLRSYQIRKGKPRTFVVAVDHESNQVYTHFISRKFKNREGTLLYASLVP